MTKKEQKAIEYLKNRYWYIDDYDVELAVKTLLNLVEKQQKEMEKLKQANERLFEMGKDKAMTKLINEITDNDYISKDKIREKIEELEERRKKEMEEVGCFFDNGALRILKDLLEE